MWTNDSRWIYFILSSFQPSSRAQVLFYSGVWCDSIICVDCLWITDFALYSVSQEMGYSRSWVNSREVEGRNGEEKSLTLSLQSSAYKTQLLKEFFWIIYNYSHMGRMYIWMYVAVQQVISFPFQPPALKIHLLCNSFFIRFSVTLLWSLRLLLLLLLVVYSHQSISIH